MQNENLWNRTNTTPTKLNGFRKVFCAIKHGGGASAKTKEKRKTKKERACVRTNARDKRVNKKRRSNLNGYRKWFTWIEFSDVSKCACACVCLFSNSWCSNMAWLQVTDVHSFVRCRTNIYTSKFATIFYCCFCCCLS